MKTLAYNMTPEGLSKLLRTCRMAGYTVNRDNTAGTAQVSIIGLVVLVAIQIGKGWLVRADPRCVQVETEQEITPHKAG